MSFENSYSPNQDYYQLLGITPFVDMDAIKKAYRRKSLEYHPDKNPHQTEWATKKFNDLLAGYELLPDLDKRSEYDQYYNFCKHHKFDLSDYTYSFYITVSHYALSENKIKPFYSSCQRYLERHHIDFSNDTSIFLRDFLNTKIQALLTLERLTNFDAIHQINFDKIERQLTALDAEIKPIADECAKLRRLKQENPQDNSIETAYKAKIALLSKLRSKEIEYKTERTTLLNEGPKNKSSLEKQLVGIHHELATHLIDRQARDYISHKEKAIKDQKATFLTKELSELIPVLINKEKQEAEQLHATRFQTFKKQAEVHQKALGSANSYKLWAGRLAKSVILSPIALGLYLFVPYSKRIAEASGGYAEATLNIAKAETDRHSALERLSSESYQTALKNKIVSKCEVLEDIRAALKLYPELKSTSLSKHMDSAQELDEFRQKIKGLKQENKRQFETGSAEFKDVNGSKIDLSMPTEESDVTLQHQNTHRYVM